MSIFLTILGVLLSLILLILMLRVHVVIEADTSARVYIKALFIKIRLYPKYKKALNINDYTPNRIKKRANKKKKKEEAKQKKKEKKERRKNEKEKTAQVTKASQKKNKLSLSELSELLSLVLELTKTFFSKFRRRLRLDMTKIHINVGGEDAAKTAITYGVISSGVCCLCEFLDLMLTSKPQSDHDIMINADFLSEQTTLDVTISASLRVWQALDIALAIAISFVKQKILNK